MKKLDPKPFLQSSNPEEVLLAILCNVNEEQMEDLLRSLTSRLVELLPNNAKINKFIQQLLVLTRLRQVNDKSLKIIKNMPVTIDISKDILYKKGKIEGREEGREKGREEGQEAGLEKKELEIIGNCIKAQYTLKEIAIITSLSIQKINALIKKYNLK
jgi:predicted transposase/invertase (TIGR01784 family)